MQIVLVFLAAFAADESKLRSEFAGAFKAKETAKRVEALKKLEGSKEEKTVEAIAAGLKDPEKDVKKAAADVLATCEDGAGAAIKPLCTSLVNKMEDPDVRYACAQALAKAKYRTEAVAAMIETISGIENKDRHLHVFGKNVTVVLEGVTKESFDYGKNTPHLWQEWWKENKAKYQKDDDAKRAELKKSK